MALTGLPEAPLGPPERLVDGVEALARPFGGLDALALLGERAAHMGLWRRGTTSCGGSCRLLPSRDGYLAVSLARDDDFEAVPAWLELDEHAGDRSRDLVGGRRRRRAAGTSTSSSRGPPCSGCRWRRSERRRGHRVVPRSRSVPRRRGTRPAWSSSTCRPCGPARSAATCWPARARR